MTHSNQAIYPLSNFPGQAQEELTILYKELAAVLSKNSAACSMCGACCNFKQYEHELWLTSLELSHLLDQAGSPPPAKDGICPYQKESKCTAREGRTLGCRIFHCTLDKNIMEELHEVYLQKIMAICKKYNLENQYGELLSSLSHLSQ